MTLLALLLACTDPSSTDTSKTGDSDSGDVTGVPDVEVLVIGGGPAGLAAAIEASRAGASVLLLEREGQAGGAILWGSALMLFAGSPLQEDAGIDDSPEELLAEWPEFTGGDPDDEWVQYFAEHTVDMVYDWLHDMDVIFDPPIPDTAGGLLPRVHQVEGGGEALVGRLVAQLPIGVVRLDSSAESFVMDGDRVAGVEWMDTTSGVTTTTTAGTVIVATGGFMADLDRVRSVKPELEGVDLLLDSWPGDDGNGLDLLTDLGATTQNLQAVGLYAHALADIDGSNYAVSIPWASESMYVDQDGLRFMDEFDVQSFANGTELATHPGAYAWVVADQNRAGGMVGSGTFGNSYAFDELVAAGAGFEEDSLDALATDCGLDAGAVAASAEQFNAYAETLSGDPYRLDGGLADALDTPPYYAVKMQPSAAKSFGGIDTDLAGRVLDTDGNPLAGVYAAGELTGMAGGTLVGDNGFTGSLTAVILGARVAGAAAAAEAMAAEE